MALDHFQINVHEWSQNQQQKPKFSLNLWENKVKLNQISTQLN